VGGGHDEKDKIAAVDKLSGQAFMLAKHGIGPWRVHNDEVLEKAGGMRMNNDLVFEAAGFDTPVAEDVDA
jgi:hypothetical protein